MTLKHIFSTVATNSRISRNISTASWTLQSFRSRLNILVKICIINHQITCNYGQWKFHLDFSLPRDKGNFLCFMPNSEFVLQLNNSLNTFVIIIYVYSSNHFGSFQIANAKSNLTDSVTSNKFNKLRRCRKLRIYLKI